MKSIDISYEYGLDGFEFRQYIKENATFPIKETFMGDIILPDDLNIEEFIKPFLLKKEEEKRKIKEKERLEEEERLKERREKYFSRIEQLREKEYTGYYEYKVISMTDIGGLFKSNSGRVNIEEMTMVLNELGVDGWHLVTAYSNELGKNALSGGAGGALLGVNSTVDENILIFERFVKI